MPVLSAMVKTVSCTNIKQKSTDQASTAHLSLAKSCVFLCKNRQIYLHISENFGIRVGESVLRLLVTTAVLSGGFKNKIQI